MATDQLDLAINAQVMLIKNVDEVLVNGAIGRVVDFVDPELGLEIECIGPSTYTESFIRQQTDGNQGKLPVVEFSRQDGSTFNILVLPDVWKLETPKGEIQAQRVQVRDAFYLARQ